LGDWVERRTVASESVGVSSLFAFEKLAGPARLPAGVADGSASFAAVPSVAAAASKNWWLAGWKGLAATVNSFAGAEIEHAGAGYLGVGIAASGDVETENAGAEGFEDAFATLRQLD
jgi:hypothetical protein